MGNSQCNFKHEADHCNAGKECENKCCRSDLRRGVPKALPLSSKGESIIVDVAVAGGSASWRCICCDVKGHSIAILHPEHEDDAGVNVDSFSLLLGQLKPEIYALLFVASTKVGESLYEKQCMASISIDESWQPSKVRDFNGLNHLFTCRHATKTTGNAFVFFVLFRGGCSHSISLNMTSTEVFPKMSIPEPPDLDIYLPFENSIRPLTFIDPIPGIPSEALWHIEVVAQMYHIFETSDFEVALDPYLPKLIKSLHTPTINSL